MHVLPIPCLRDNYAYLLRSDHSSAIAIVDVSEAGPVLQALAQAGDPAPSAILSTHHHLDHVGGNAELCARFAGLAVYGHAAETARGRIPAQTHGLGDGEEATLLGLRVRALHIPGHTLTAVAFYFPAAGVVFTGDTLFGAGCGRLFEGTPAQMHASLQYLLTLPPQTQVYCGHEYTERNLAFAAQVEPDNAAIAARQARVAALRTAGQPSVPSTLAEEAETNPFLRTHVKAVQEAARARGGAAAHPGAPDAVAVFAQLRRWKDEF